MDNVKKCQRCEKILPIDSFGILKRSKDGHNRMCKPCTADYMAEHRARGVPKSRVLKDVAKLEQLMENLPKNDYNIGKAYHEAGLTKNLDNASVCATRFLERVSDEALEIVLAQYRNPEKGSKLIMAFDDYCQSVLQGGTHTEKRDMFREAFRLFGWGTEKHEVRAGGLDPENRKKKLEEIHNVIEGKVVSTEEE